MRHDREPIGHTCPNIDKLIEKVKKIEFLIKKSNKDEDLLSLKSVISDIDWEIGDFESDLELLRYDNDKLRTWGQNEAFNVNGLNAELELIESYKID